MLNMPETLSDTLIVLRDLISPVFKFRQVIVLLLLVVAVISLIRRRDSPQFEDYRSAFSFRSFLGGCLMHLALGASLFIVLRHLADVVYCAGPFEAHIFCLAVFAFAVILFCQAGDFIPLMTYAKIPYILCLLVGFTFSVVLAPICFYLGDLGVPSILIKLGVGVVAVAIVVVTSKYGLSSYRKKRERARTESAIVRNLRFVLLGGYDFHHPLRQALSLVGVTSCLAVLMTVAATWLPVAIPCEKEHLDSNSDESPFSVVYVDALLRPIGIRYYVGENTEPYAVRTIRYRCASADVVFDTYRKDALFPERIARIYIDEGGYVDTRWDDTGVLTSETTYDADGVRQNQVLYDGNSAPKARFVFMRDAENVEWYMRVSPEGSALGEWTRVDSK